MTGEVKWEHLVTRVKGTFLNGSLPKDVECNSNNWPKDCIKWTFLDQESKEHIQI